MPGINVIQELSALGVEFEVSGNGYVKVVCPFHDDHNPSLSVGVADGKYKCFAAGCSANKGGDFFALVSRITQKPRDVIVGELSSRYDLYNKGYIDPSVIEREVDTLALEKSKTLRQELLARGLTQDTISRFRLGATPDGRITIPVEDQYGGIVNTRIYAPGAPSADKMKNLRDRGEVRPYPISQLKFDEIVFTGGEVKALAGLQTLNEVGVGCICLTNGEDSWLPGFDESLKGKLVTLAFDIDAGGQSATRDKAHRLAGFAREVRVIDFGLDPKRYPTGDLNDFVAQGGDLRRAYKEAKPWKLLNKDADDSKILELPLSEALHADHCGKRVTTTAVISAVDRSPYAVPFEVKIDCNRDQDFCPTCPIMPKARHEVYELATDSSQTLGRVSVNTRQRDYTVKEDLGIPEACRACSVQVERMLKAEITRISPDMDMQSDGTDRMLQAAVIVSDDTVEMNVNYSMTGRVQAHPATQEIAFVVDKLEPTRDALSCFALDNPEAMQIFQPSKWTVEGLRSKFDELYEDFETHVTQIYFRRDAHLLADCAYHTPLFLRLEDKAIKGWGEVLIIGDSAQGKSEIVQGLQSHYGLGHINDCKTSTAAGLLGGIIKSGDGSWLVTWGIIPQNDRRLVVLEETKGASTEVLGQLTAMRSTGIAEQSKIEHSRAKARTRLIAVSNPRSDRQVATYSFGVETARELMGSLEDVRRFDACLVLSAKEVDAVKLEKVKRSRRDNPVTHRHTAKLCNKLVLWGWTLPDSAVRWEDTDYLMDKAAEFGQKYTDVIPIVDSGSIRFKIARLAAGLAVRTFSTIDDGYTLYVRNCHIDYILQFLTRIYDSDIMGYARLTQAVRMDDHISDVKEVVDALKSTTYPKDLIESLQTADVFQLGDLELWTGSDRWEAQMLLSLLFRKRAVKKAGRGYVKSPAFIELLRDLARDVKNPEVPAYMQTKDVF